MNDTLQDRSDAAVETRRRREQRADATVEVTYDETSAYECPECGDEERIGIYGRDYAWEHKRETERRPKQTTLCDGGDER